jgi:L-cystine uptake protein TcyP (sodium:dicarboxylate symporter family)
MNIPLILNLIVALAVCYALYRMQAAHVSFTQRVFTGLGLCAAGHGNPGAVRRRLAGGR